MSDNRKFWVVKGDKGVCIVQALNEEEAKRLASCLPCIGNIVEAKRLRV